MFRDLTFLYEFLVRKNTKVKKMYAGSMNITNQQFTDAYENPDTPEFKALAAQVAVQVRAIIRTPG